MKYIVKANNRITLEHVFSEKSSDTQSRKPKIIRCDQVQEFVANVINGVDTNHQSLGFIDDMIALVPRPHREEISIFDQDQRLTDFLAYLNNHKDFHLSFNVDGRLGRFQPLSPQMTDLRHKKVVPMIVRPR